MESVALLSSGRPLFGSRETRQAGLALRLAFGSGVAALSLLLSPVSSWALHSDTHKVYEVRASTDNGQTWDLYKLFQDSRSYAQPQRVILDLEGYLHTDWDNVVGSDVTYTPVNVKLSVDGAEVLNAGRSQTQWILDTQRYSIGQHKLEVTFEYSWQSGSRTAFGNYQINIATAGSGDASASTTTTTVPSLGGSPTATPGTTGESTTPTTTPPSASATPFSAVSMQPNPFYPGSKRFFVDGETGRKVKLAATNICFTLNTTGHVYLSFLNSKRFLGRMYAKPYFVKGRMFNRYLARGKHCVEWNGAVNGRFLGPGTYRWVLTANDGRAARTYEGTVTFSRTS